MHRVLGSLLRQSWHTSGRGLARQQGLLPRHPAAFASVFPRTIASDAATQRQELLDKLLALPADEQESIIGELREVSEAEGPPTNIQLWRYSLLTSIPYVGFGFADNLLMIVAGEWIEFQLGGTFHLSTMAAAGLGNLFSDIVGLGLGGIIEEAAEKMGLQPHGMSCDQMNTRHAKITYAVSAVTGISIGCLLGMFPLYFEDQEQRRLKVMFDMIDSDGSGYLDKSELRSVFKKLRIPMTDEELDRMMATFDKDGNGTLDFGEFYQFVKKEFDEEKVDALFDKFESERTK